MAARPRGLEITDHSEQAIQSLEKELTMEKKLMGEKITTVGALMIALSVVLPIVGLRGAMLNSVYGVLGLVGVVLGAVGMFMWRILKK